MYKANLVKEKVKTKVKSSGKTQKEILAIAGVNENILNQMSDKKGISSFDLAKIADALNCSVDYLLGRDEPLQMKATEEEWYTIISQMSEEEVDSLREYVQFLIWKRNQAL